MYSVPLKLRVKQLHLKNQNTGLPFYIRSLMPPYMYLSVNARNMVCVQPYNNFDKTNFQWVFASGNVIRHKKTGINLTLVVAAGVQGGAAWVKEIDMSNEHKSLQQWQFWDKYIRNKTSTGDWVTLGILKGGTKPGAIVICEKDDGNAAKQWELKVQVN